MLQSCRFFHRFAMPRSKVGQKRAPVDTKNLSKAVAAISCDEDRKISLREACKIYNVKLATLSRHLKHFKESGDKNFTFYIPLKLVFISNDIWLIYRTLPIFRNNILSGFIETTVGVPRFMRMCSRVHEHNVPGNNYL